MILLLTGGRTVRASPARVWAALHDVTCLRLCVPGCSSIRRMSDTRFDLSVRVPFGPVAIEFSGSVETDDCDPLRALTLIGRGSGGLAGLAVGTARVSLAAIPAGCHLSYTLHAEPSGPFAAAGTLLLRGLARTLVEQFAATFATVVEQENPAVGLRPALTPIGRTS